MQAIIPWLNTTGQAWTDRFWRATWQGAIVILVAFALTLLLSRLSPRVRCWLWRLTYIKLLLLLLWTTPIELALLPAVARPQSAPPNVEMGGTGHESRDRKSAPTITADNSEPIAATADGSPNNEQPASTTETSSTSAPVTETPPPTIAATSPSETEATTVPLPNKSLAERASPNRKSNALAAALSLQSYLFMLWLAGLLAVIAWLTADARRAWQLLRNSQPLRSEPWQSLSDDVCRRLGLRRKIRLRSSPTARSPLLIRFLRPAIILPKSMAEFLPLTHVEGRVEGEAVQSNATTSITPQTSPLTNTTSDLSLAIAHEAAHLRRHDLTWNALTAIVHIALYFHPLVWLAHRRTRLEQEMACDELVLEKLNAAPQDYGRMLINVVTKSP